MDKTRNQEKVKLFTLFNAAGVQDFTEIADLAAHGDHGKVDTLFSDIKIENNISTYSEIPDSCALFCFGKCHEAKFDGQSKL